MGHKAKVETVSVRGLEARVVTHISVYPQPDGVVDGGPSVDHGEEEVETLGEKFIDVLPGARCPPLPINNA